MGAAREVLCRRRDRLPRLPRRLHGVAQRCRGALPSSSGRILPGRRREQLPWNRVWTFRGERGHVAYQGLRSSSSTRWHSPRISSSCTSSSRPGSSAFRRRRRRSCRDSAPLRREQALVVPPTMRRSRARGCARSFRSRSGLDGRAASPTAPFAGGTGRPLDQPFAPGPGPAVTESIVVARFLDDPEGRRGGSSAIPQPETDATFDEATRRWTVRSGRARRVRSPSGRSRTARSRLRGMDGPSGCVGDGARAGRLVRRQGSQRVVDVDSAEPRLLRGSRRLAPPSVMAYARPARVDLVRALALVLQPRRGVPERTARGAAAGLFARSHVLHRFRGARLAPALVWPVWLLAAVAVFLGGLRIGLNLETPRCDRRRLRRGDRRGPDPRRGCALRTHAPQGHGTLLRARRHERCRARLDPGERSLRVVQPTWRHVRPDVVSRVRSGRAPCRWSRQWDSLPQHTRQQSCSICSSSWGSCSWTPIRRPAAGGRAGVRLGRVPVHRVCDELELERRDHARDPRLGLLALDVGRRAGCGRRALGVDEVRDAPARSALAHVPERARRGARSGSRRRSSSSLAVSRSSCSSRVSSTRHAFSSVTPSSINSTAGPLSRPGTGAVPRPRTSGSRAVQLIVQIGVLALAGVVAVIPTRKGPLELAALSAAVLIGFELALTHWSYLYIPWFLPFVLLALLLRTGRRCCPRRTSS